jgi:uncharacterized protein DUF6438/ankyrin repeat protein
MWKPAVVATLALTAAAAAQTTTPVITLERTSCFGECPVYRVEISSDGEVRYIGSRFVRVTGPVSTRIPREAVAALVDEFARIGYRQFDDRYEFIRHPDGSRSMVTDLPTTITSLRIGSQEKRVVDYVGAPPALKELEARIDRVAGTRRWIAVTPDVVLELERGGWNAAGDEGAKWLRDAVYRGEADSVQALLDAHADPNGSPSPLLALAHDPTIIRLLVAGGADVNGRNGNGDTILMVAIRSRRADRVTALLAAGARPDAVNPQTGQTALQLALQSAATPPPPPFPGEPAQPDDAARIVALLRTAGAK